jgi:hypothetical protein
MKFMNVKEKWFLYDTIAVSPYVDSLAHPIPGWYSSFQDIAAADDLTFFNSRNKSIGLAYNNQESRDQIPYALEAESISVGFFAPSTSSQEGTLDQGTFRGRVDGISSYWENELPQHTSTVFRVNQDERLKTTAAMVSAGYGPCGHSMGQGNTSNTGGVCASITAGGFGAAHLKYRWNFPTTIGIPRRATIAVTLRFVEWARSNLAKLWGPGNIQVWNGEPAIVYKPTMFFIQCLITGTRQVQQRAEYHA